MRFFTANYRAWLVIGLPTLLAVLSFCAIYPRLQKRAAKLADLVALAAAWAIGVISLAAGAVVSHNVTSGQLVGRWFVLSLAVLLPLLFSALLYQRLVSKNATVAVGLAAIVGVAVSPACFVLGVFAGCLTGLAACPHLS